MRALVVVLQVVVAFVAMEPLTYAMHRWVMHGPGRTLHHSHHRPAAGRVEANDLFPVFFAALVGGALAIGFNVGGYAWLVPVGAGITLYGVAYGVVHDGFIHGRLPFVARFGRTPLQRLAEAHRIHHLYGGEPYGMLLPVVPAPLRARAAGTDRQPLARRPM